VVHGIAKEIDKKGNLVILTPEPLALAAADVWHLRN
jgi:BirA family transcriptional regulator, biotin operon repressor / biotin---[acetyl-CoA-carboxylase] ligase